MNIKRSTTLVAVLFACGAAAPMAGADDIFWASATSGTLTNGANWVGGSPPSATDVAVFSAPGAYTIDIPVGAQLGAIRVDGATTTFDLNAFTFGLSILGNSPPALLVGATAGSESEAIITSGTMEADVVLLADAPGSMATLRLEASDARLETGFLSQVGAAGTGEMVVSGGADVSGSGFFIGGVEGAQGTVSVSGSGSRFAPSFARVGRAGTGTLLVSAGGVIETDGLTVGSTGGVGTANFVSGASLNISGDLEIGVTDGLGAMTFGGATLSGVDIVVGDSGGDGEFIMSGGLGLLTGDLIVGRAAMGIARFSGGAAAFDEIRVGTGTAGVGELRIGTAVSAGTSVTVGAGLFSIGSVRLDASGQLSSPLVTIASSGSLRGDGIVTGRLRNAGLIAPEGVVTVDGDYDQFTDLSNGVLEVRVASEPRRLEVSGVAALAGTLRVNVLGGFAPQTGATFTLLSADSITGSFGQIVTPSEDWTVEISGTDVVAIYSGTAPADLNGDGVVDAADLAALVAQWGATGGAADLNGDGVVGAEDLATLIAAWG